MKQVLFRIPGLNLPVYGFGLMVVLGFYVALVVAVRRCRTEKLDPAVIYDLAVWMLVGGMIGARLFYVVEYWGERVHTFAQVFKLWEGGIVFYGGAIGGFAALFLYRMVRPFPLLATLDALAPSVALGSGLGRLGCFLNGCCFGDVCDIPGLGVRFPIDSPPWNVERLRNMIPPDAVQSLPLHPTQLYAALDGLVLFLLLTAYFPLRRRDGEVFALWMIAYPVTRFLIELLRDDEAALGAGLTISQVVSVGLVLAGMTAWAYLVTRPAGRHADGPGATTETPSGAGA
jgi:phosphatidylglycerol---prolipoprotein diacylglyceryl transferase